MKRLIPTQLRTTPTRCQMARRGMLLVVVLVVVVILSLAGFSFTALMFTEKKGVYLQGDDLRLQSMVGSGIEYLQSQLELPPVQREQMGSLLDNPMLFRGVNVYGESGDEQSTQSGRFSIVSPNVELGEPAGVRFGVENESARLNLAVLPEWDRQQAGAGQQALMNLPGMTESIADAILDWIDADSEQRQCGAESDHYSGLESPYSPRNGVPESIEELLLVRGVTRELLFGADRNRNHTIEERELQIAAGLSTSESGQSGAPWASYLTLYSAERNVDRLGLPRIHLNTNDLRALQQTLSENFEEEWVRFIIAYRQYGPYGGSKSASVGLSTPLDMEVPAAFRIPSLLDLIGTRVRIASSASGSAGVLESPFTDEPDKMKEYLPKWRERTSVVATTRIPGRINVNRAPSEVLSAVPGLDAATAAQIIAARNSGGSSENTSRLDATWLLTEGLADLATMTEILPYVTARGDVFRAQVVAFFDDRLMSARTQVVVDASFGRSRLVRETDLRPLGRGYSAELLGAEVADVSTTGGRRKVGTQQPVAGLGRTLLKMTTIAAGR